MKLFFYNIILLQVLLLISCSGKVTVTWTKGRIGLSDSDKNNNSNEIVIPYVPGTISTPWANQLLATAAGITTKGLFIDPDGNTIILGRSSVAATVDFGSGVFLNSTVNNQDFLAKYSTNGTILNSKNFTTQGGATLILNYLGVDGNSNIFVAGTFTGSVDFGNGLVNAATLSMFVLKMDKNYIYKWVKIYNDSGGGNVLNGNSNIAIDDRGGIAVKGNVSVGETINLDGTIISAAVSGRFILKLNSNGEKEWVFPYNNSQAATGKSQTIFDGAGNLYLVEPHLDLAPANYGFGPVSCANGYNLTLPVLFKISSAGVYEFANPLCPNAGSGSVNLQAIDLDSSENVVLSVVVSGPAGIDFGGGNLPGAAGLNTALARIDANGNHIWSKLYQTGLIGELKVSDQDDIVIVASGIASTTLDGIPYVVTGSNDLFIGRIDSVSNNFNSIQIFNGGSGTSILSTGFMALDNQNQIVSFGHFNESALLPGGNLTNADANNDGFVTSFPSIP